MDSTWEGAGGIQNAAGRGGGGGTGTEAVLSRFLRGTLGKAGESWDADL